MQNAPLNGNGAFEFRAVAPGSYVLAATAGQGEYTRVPVEVGTTPIDGLVIRIEEAARIEGRIWVAGEEQAAPEETMIWFGDGVYSPAMAASNDKGGFHCLLARGHYSIRVSPLPGDLIVRAVKVADQNVLNEGLAIEGSGKIAMEIVLAHEGGTLAGTVLDADEKPVAGATVVLVPDAARRGRSDLTQSLESDQHGQFSLQGLEPGAYLLFAWDDIEPGVWWDAEFLKKVEAQGAAVTIAPQGKAAATVHATKP